MKFQNHVSGITLLLRCYFFASNKTLSILTSTQTAHFLSPFQKNMHFMTKYQITRNFFTTKQLFFIFLRTGSPHITHILFLIMDCITYLRYYHLLRPRNFNTMSFNQFLQNLNITITFNTK